MKRIVITGSTRGIGYGLAEAFLARDCAVVVSSRTQTAVDEAISRLAEIYDPDRIYGLPCDVSDFEQIQALWDQSQAHYGQIDIWINNAGLGQAQINIVDYTPGLIHKIIDTNLIGAIQGTTVALRGMQKQGFGAIYNMEGFGSNGGRMTPGLGLYGTSKAGLRFFNDNLFQEAKDTPVITGALQPGMVITDMITRPYQDKPEEWQRVKGIFNIIGNKVETVTPWLADKVLANQKNGARISYMSQAQIMLRFLTAPVIHRNVIDEA